MEFGNYVMSAKGEPDRTECHLPKQVLNLRTELQARALNLRGWGLIHRRNQG